MAQTFHENDKEGLRIFMRQSSAEDGKINAEQLGLQISDTLNWQNDEAWVEKIVGLVWNNALPQKLIATTDGIGIEMPNSWNGRHLAGTLDASKWSNLTNLVCSKNHLTALNVSANTVLGALRCNDNLLTELDVSANTELILLHCGYNLLSTLDVSTNINLTDFKCNDNQLTSLDLSKNPSLFFLDCSNNCLPLSTLFSLSEHKITLPTVVGGPARKILGTQNLLPQSVSTGSEKDFSDQNIFKGIRTQFNISLNEDIPAPQSDYSITDGRITFFKTGNYIVTMTNAAIVSNDYPAMVIAKIEVGNAGNTVLQDATNIKIYPNPTSGLLVIDHGQLKNDNYCIYNVTGQMIMQGKLQTGTTTLNVSALTKGVYYLRMFDFDVKFIKQ